MEEIHKLRAQISSIVQTNFPDVQTGFEANLRPPSALQVLPVYVYSLRPPCSRFHHS